MSPTPAPRMRVSLDLDALRASLAASAEPLEPLGMTGLIIGPAALDRLGELLSDLVGSPRSRAGPGVRSGAGDVVVLAAATPMTVRGAVLRDAVAERISPRYGLAWTALGGADGSLHADEHTVAAATKAAADARCVVTVGSGTITDIGKAATGPGTPLVAVQTATSVNGYADPFSVLLTAGVKRTTPTRWPDWLIADTDVLADAPDRLNLAGIGDMAAMFTATADWYLAALLGAGGPQYSAEAAGLVRPHGEAMFDLRGAHPRGPDLQGPGGRLADLARLLTLSGIGMGVTGSTASASGMEHAISHLLEMAATADGGSDAAAWVSSLHGEQVGVASVVAAATWEHVRARIAAGALGRPARLPDPDATADRIGAAFASLDPSGAMAAECLTDYTAKIRLLGSGPDPLATLRQAWADHEAVVAGLLTGPVELAAGLRSAGLPARFGDLPAPVSEALARWAVANCALQRRRFGVADLAMLMGAWEDDDVDAVLALAERAGAP
jgi:glycerol-1-phosphate dehydrogenase [NAD(P)+]